MKATLEFSLPDEDHEYKSAVEGMNWQCVCINMYEWLRSKQKHGHSFKTVEDALDGCARELLEEIDSRNLLLE